LRGDVQEDALLDMLQCTPEAVAAGIDPNEIERLAQKAKRLRCEQEGMTLPDSVERICAMYLQPETRGGELSGILERAVGVDEGADR